MKYVNIIILIMVFAGPTIVKVISGLLKEREEKQKYAKQKLNRTFGQPTVEGYKKDAMINDQRKELAANRKAEAQQWRELQQQRNHHRNQQSTTQTNEEWKLATQSKKEQESRPQTRSRYSAIQETLIQAGIIQQQPPQRQRQQQQQRRVRQQQQQQQQGATSHTGASSRRRMQHVAQHQNRHLQTDQQQQQQQKSRRKEPLSGQDKPGLKSNITKVSDEQHSTKPVAAVTPNLLFFGGAGIPFNRTTLRQAIILKELLDKPVALREEPSYY